MVLDMMRVDPNDYRNYREGKYPEPDQRYSKEHFPPAEDLFIYGEDYPMPASREDLRCRYNEDERDPLDLEKLRGYRVPPLGLSSVGIGGSGHARGFIYNNGTFREDVVSIGKPLGVDGQEIQVLKSEAKTNAITRGIVKAFEAKGQTLNFKTDSDVLEALAQHVTENILDDDAPVREQRMWFNDIHKIFANQEEILEQQKSIAKQMEKLSTEALDVILQETDRIVKERMDSVEGEAEDIDDEPMGFDLDGDDEN